MKKISLVFAILSLFIGISSLLSINAFAYNTCDPNNIFLPCTSPNGRDMDTVMRGGTRTVFYLAESHTVDHRINHKENYWDIVIIEPPYSRYSGCLWKPAYVASFYSASIDRTQANFLWQGVGSVSSLTINLDPSGGGGVASIPEGDGIYCGIDGYNICQFDFQKNSDVEIQAYPADGWVFASWEWNNGASSSTENPMTINMDSAKTVKAKFKRSLGWPLSGSPENRTILSSFGDDWLESCDGLIMKHTGIDISATTTDTVYAAEAGIVKVAQTDQDWGGWVTIEHSSLTNPYTTVYFHIMPSVSVNATVSKGDPIGTVVNYGSTIHLHFGLRNGLYANTSNRGRLPQTVCGGDPAFQENFEDPSTFLFE